MKKIIEASELPKEEKVYLKKLAGTWKVIHPIKNEDGSINWFNLLTGGSWFNLIAVAIIVTVTLGVLYEYVNNIQILLDCFKDPLTLEKCKQSFMPNYTKIYVP